jgi:hypothetical protein
MRKLFTFGVLMNLLANITVPAAAQDSQRVAASFAASDGPVEAFRRLHGASDTVFAGEVRKMSPGSDVSEALEAQSAYFIEQFLDATKEQFGKGVVKSRELNKKRIEAAAQQTTPARVRRLYGKGISTDLDIDFVEIPTGEIARSLASPDGVQITEVETETSVRSTATDQKSIDTPEATVTRTQTVGSDVNFDGKNTMSKSMSTDETVESASKTDRRKVTKTSKMSFASSLEICPDFAGVVRGKGSAKFGSKTTLNTGSQLAAMTTDYTVDYRVTAFVNDNAEVTHFDLKATVVETTFGFDRALRLGLITSTNGVADGTRSMFVQFDGNTPPSSVDGEYGMKRDIPSTLGKETVKPLPTNTEADNGRLITAAGPAIGAIVIDLDLLMRSSISRWQHYECVSIKCTAPKTVLAPNESVDVTAVSISTLDQSRFNAKLNGTGTQTVTPGDQSGTPSATYSLTAPEKEKATFIAKSVSRRGIGLEVLEIPVEEAKKKPPVKKTAPKTKKCDQGWTGTVKAVRTYRDLERGKADGRLLRQLRNVESTYSVEISLTGTRDTTGGIVNNFHGNARASYVKDEQRERNYASGKMSCNKSIIESPETQKNLLNYKGDSSGQILVAIAIIGNTGHIDFSPPPMQAVFTHAYVYETACPAYDQINTKTIRSEYLQDVTETGFEIDFEIDPSAPDALTGSKTVKESDGSETTYTWNISRCQ